MNGKLTKSEALELITPVIDNEASAEEREAFMAYIAHDDEVRQEYQAMKALKSVVRSRCPSAKAPDSLKKFLSSLCSSELSEAEAPPIYDVPCKQTVSSHNNPEQPGDDHDFSNWWYFATAAVVLITALLWGSMSYFNSTANSSVYNLEEYAYQHFTKHDGRLVSPTISTASLGFAEIQLAQDYDMPMTIPELEKAEFKGVVYDEFVPGYSAPLLEYHLSEEDQYIYIFAFRLDKMEEFGKLVRNEEAVNTCTKSQDFHVRNVNGKHVVSWKWNDIWYTAISNHDGNTLASLVKPLGYTNR
ncbi:hypothetical protein [Fodinibius sp. Rm-B-1B1-1]|uniref:anti-sigma factor family protein n=1 Tax=Fodinibius alkaliphilus TaxID=3140241 RepID=UPI00315ACAF7